MLFPYLVAALLLLYVVEQLSYWKKKRGAPGPVFVIPVVGNAIRLISNPTKFWDKQTAAAERAGYSVNYLLGKFAVFIRESELSHQVFNNVAPDAFSLIGHPFGKKLFGDHNLIYLFGQEHRDLRARIAPNFTKKALSTYASIQYCIILTHFRRWAQLSSSSPISLRFLIRDLNLATSQEVFVGPYLEAQERDRFREDYFLFNIGLMAVPFDLPGFAFRKARLAVLRLVETLAGCVTKSKTRMRSVDDAKPRCLVDFWMQETIKEIDASRGQPPPHSDDLALGGFIFDFLFAAQDASTSSLLWAVTLLESHPDVLARLREEISAIWPAQEGQEPTLDQLQEMKYAQAVAREVVRYRAPATLVTHIAMRDFPLTEDYTIPKGSIVFPSVFESCLQGFTDPHQFDPDRFLGDRKEEELYKRKFLAFGAGPHHCVGQRYALNHLVLFMVLFVSFFDFQRHETPGCDDIVYNPTIAPKDGCSVFLRRRNSREF